MKPAILAGSASAALGTEIARHLRWDLVAHTSETFPDGERHLLVEPVGDLDLYVVQATGPPVDENVIELLLIADACRRAGAGRLTAVLPYFGYARQDRRTRPGEALGIRVVCELLATAGIERIVVLDPHTDGFEAVCGLPAEVVSSVSYFVSALRPHLVSDAIVVAPDEGAVKLAGHFASELGLPFALVRKKRLSGDEVSVKEVVGDVTGRPLVLVDDMISTGATLVSAIGALLDRGAVPDVVVAAVHGLLVGRAVARLSELPLRRLVLSDSLVPPSGAPFRTTVVGVSSLLAQCIQRLHFGEKITNEISDERHSQCAGEGGVVEG